MLWSGSWPANALLPDVPKIMAFLRTEEPSSVNQETTLPEKSDGSKSRNVISENPVPIKVLKIEKQINLTHVFETIWKKFETFQLNEQGKKDTRIVLQFLSDALPLLEQTGVLAVIDKQLGEHNLEEIRHICSEFDKLPDRTAKKAMDDLWSKWQGAEKALELVIGLVRGTRHCKDNCLKNHKGMDDCCSERGKTPVCASWQISVCCEILLWKRTGIFLTNKNRSAVQCWALPSAARLAHKCSSFLRHGLHFCGATVQFTAFIS